MAPQDSFIEEEEDVCPLCIEEFDLSDRNFRPCPCGYQVCQFCFNNIKNNMNGLCPACRRPYDERTIQWKVVTQEEVAEFRANIQKNQKKRAQEQRQKEVQKREAEKENRKNLIGVRVVQKNLVYITGLAPTVREDELLKTLRKPEFFGQYGNIQKISISNRKSSDGQHQSLGIYVTFERPEEAIRCIQAVHGSHNGDRTLKAQHGTTKYCSAWLKNEKCSNPGCMFLHEQGDEEDSYTRQDLSSMNSIHTQRPLPAGGAGPSRTASRQQMSQPTPPPAAQPMARSSSKDDSDNGLDSSALPSSANWARHPQQSRRGSVATSAAASSPAISTSLPAAAEPPTVAGVAEEVAAAKQPEEHAANVLDTSLKNLLRALGACTLPPLPKLSADELGPPMFDMRGGEKRRAMREEEDSRIGEQDDQPEAQEASEGEVEAGSLALGGEPEDREVAADNTFDQRRPGTQPPIQRNADGVFGSTGMAYPAGRTMTPQQFAARANGFGEMPPGITGQANAFQNQGHNRQSSRFSFANDNPNTATNVKVAANPRIMAQQSSMMPTSYQPQGNQYYGTSMSGPPPGLKSTGTPPSMFGQFGGGFSSAGKDSPNDLLQNLIGRSRAGNGQGHDAGKREYMISSFSNQYPPSTSTPAPASGLLASLYGNQPGAFQDFGSKQKKKGKKHRHANTSSSGGSGLVDLADPSILQARMQHQSNAGVGQGAFGQSQGGYNPNMMYNADDELPSFDEAMSSVDALVADDPLGDAPPGFAVPEAAPGFSPTQSRVRTPQPTPAMPKLPPSGPLVTPEQTPRKPEKAKPAPKPHDQRGGTLQEEDFPALGAPKEAKAVKGRDGPAASPKAKKDADKPEKTKKKKNDAVKPTNAQSPAETAPEKPSEVDKTAEQPALSSPARAPKTLRIVPLPKFDAPPQSPASVGPSTASRAVSVSHRPETPASEMISDTASIMSASISASRAGSPPPGIVGSSATRATTKSQQRKQRKEVLRQETKVIVESAKPEPEEHAPVLGRKKKQKKEKPVKVAPAPSRGPQPETPEPATAAKAEEKQAEEAPVKKQPQPKKGKSKAAKAEPPKEAPPPSLPQEEPPTEAEKLTPGPASVFAEISRALWTSAADKLQLLRPVSNASSRNDHHGHAPSTIPSLCKGTCCKCGEIQEDDLAALRVGKAVRKQFHIDGSRMLITPNGDCVRGLSPEEEDAFLDLQAAIAATADNPGAFVAARHQPGSGAFSLIKGRAVPNGRPNIFPCAAQPQSQDPIGKLQREDALSYINQYVLPRLNLGSSNMGLPKGSTSPRDHAAASLNSLAPYFYGPDAAAGVGIYSPAEGSRPLPDFTAAGMSSDDGGKVAAAAANGISLMSVEDAELALAAARRETDKLEKGLNSVIKRNRRLLLGGT
ncbi:hypothetical protein S40293_02475 [Stachybotrys chartarum IBT 40293]|nr:hypothetical protein S40293_02475 [Stachybotrys chartarum IBT 40293]KFA74873.1 hypothetical protein S40288_06460 [Stachybotrys chartarum IBT 40288]